MSSFTRKLVRSATRRWLTFGPSILPKGHSAAAVGRLNRNRWRHGLLRTFGAVLRVTRHGGPAAPGLFRHKTYTQQGKLIVTRNGRHAYLTKVQRVTHSSAKRKSAARTPPRSSAASSTPRTARQRQQSRVNGRRFRGKR